MFYSWTDIENLGYKNIKDFAREETRRQDYERAVVTPEGIEIIRKQRLSNLECTSPIKKYVQCMLFSKVRLANFPEQAFNEFCIKNKIQQEDIVHVSYDDGDIFLVYNKEL
jgi:hypothetical protein